MGKQSALAATMVEAVKLYVEKATSAIAPKIEQIEASLASIALRNAVPVVERGPAGENGKDGAPGAKGEPGQGVDLPALRQALSLELQALVDALPRPVAGKDGAAGKDGESIHPDTVALMVASHVERAVAALRPAEDGRDAVQVEPLPGIDEARGYPRGTVANYRGGWVRAFRDTDPVTDGLEKAGWAVALNGIAEEAEQTEGRITRRTTTYTNGKTFVRETASQAIEYKGVWREAPYARGDVVTWSGSVWHCEVANADKPGNGESWKLMVKRGQDGKDWKAPEPAFAQVRVK